MPLIIALNHLQWILACLVLIPLGIASYSVYWVALVTEPILLEACGSDRAAVGILVSIVALCSSLSAFVGYTQLIGAKFEGPFFDLHFVANVVGVVACAVALLMTSTESQRICQIMIDAYKENSTAPAVLRYEQRYDSNWAKIYFEFAFGQKSYEAYFIMTMAWIVAIVGFYAMRELVGRRRSTRSGLLSKE
jgi:hypothetical protein